MNTALRNYVLSQHRSSVIVDAYIRYRTRLVLKKKSHVVKNFVKEFIRLKAISDPFTLNVYYDNANSPETYGDLFNVLMLARFLSMSGQKVTFTILDIKHAERWGYLTNQQQSRVVKEQVMLAEYLLPEEVRIVLVDSEDKFRKENFELHTIEIGHKLLSDGSAFFEAAPYFLHCLVKKHDWRLPEKFLLQSDSKKDLDPPFVAWHIRKGLYDQRRDSSVELVQRDFAQLSTLFPGHTIRIFSDKNGLEHAFFALTGSSEVRAIWKNGVHILPQSATCFREAISEVINATFYFQRKGGGMGLVPIFSMNPYLQICPDVTNFYGKRGDSLVPWATKNQIFHHAWREIDNLPLDKFISKIRDFTY
jgi:hypothetical protein